jgi:hypothetical protein
VRKARGQTGVAPEQTLLTAEILPAGTVTTSLCCMRYSSDPRTRRVREVVKMRSPIARAPWTFFKATWRPSTVNRRPHSSPRLSSGDRPPLTSQKGKRTFIVRQIGDEAPLEATFVAVRRAFWLGDR